MSKPSEEISKYNANSGGKTDSNLSNDSLHLGGIEAEDYATKKYVQDYHNGKEELLKEYIDRQDNSNLQEAKAYTDNVVNNQDFSNFAKIPDIQALDDKLFNKINECGTTCSNKIKQVVDDVNSNFDDVNKAITNLNNKSNELFTSVSNGKKIIAEAITDKGVSTSANDSYNQMATNIRNIKTSTGGTGGNIPDGYIDTSDATATAADILNGKTAYVKGEKITGRYISTATPEVNPDNQYPTYANAEILYKRLPDTVETIQISKNENIEGTYDISGDTNLIIKYESTGNEIKLYCRNKTVTGNILYTDSRTYKNASDDITKYKTCPTYTLEQLGIETNSTVKFIRFAPMNNLEYESGYLTHITIGVANSEGKFILYTFAAYTGEWKDGDNEYIGRIYTENRMDTNSSGATVSTHYRIWKYDTGINAGSVADIRYSPYIPEYTIGLLAVIEVGSRTPIHLYTMDYLFGIDTETANTLKGYGRTDVKGALGTGIAEMQGFHGIAFYNNNRVIEVLMTARESGDWNYIIQAMYVFNENLSIIKINHIFYENIKNIMPYTLSRDCLFALRGSKIYGVVINYTTGAISFTELADTGVDIGTLCSYNNGYAMNYWMSYDNAILISNKKVYTVDFVNKTVTQLLSGSYDINKYVVGEEEILVTSQNNLYLLHMSYDNQVVEGIKYNGETFYKQVYPEHTLTAKQEDVKTGKTFIGYLGIPETGTMVENSEVSE